MHTHIHKLKEQDVRQQAMQRKAINILQHLINTCVYRFAKVDFNFKLHMSDQATFQNAILASSCSVMMIIITIIIIINHYTHNYIRVTLITVLCFAIKTFHPYLKWNNLVVDSVLRSTIDNVFCRWKHEAFYSWQYQNKVSYYLDLIVYTNVCVN